MRERTEKGPCTDITMPSNKETAVADGQGTGTGWRRRKGRCKFQRNTCKTGRGGTRTGQEARRGAAKISGNEGALRGGRWVPQPSKSGQDRPGQGSRGSARREKKGNEGSVRQSRDGALSGKSP